MMNRLVNHMGGSEKPGVLDDFASRLPRHPGSAKDEQRQSKSKPQHRSLFEDFIFMIRQKSDKRTAFQGLHRMYFIMMVSVALIGCSASGSSERLEDDTQAAISAEGENGHHENRVITLTRMQIETAGIKTGPLQELPLSNLIKVNGYLSVPPQNRAMVSPIVGGAVHKIHTYEGAEVTAGELLAELADPAFLKMQADYRKISSIISYLEEDYRRREQLFNEGVGSRREYQQIRSEYESAIADKQFFEAKLSLLGLDANRILNGEPYESAPVTAPIDGFVQHIHIHSGQYIDTASAMFEILDNSHLHTNLLIFERDVHKVKVGQEVLFRFHNQSAERLYKANIFSVGKEFEENPRAVRVHAEIENDSDDLLPGMYIDGRIVTDSGTYRTLPDEAILRNGEEHIVFVTRSEGDEADIRTDFQVIPVRPGVSDTGYTEVQFFEPLPDETHFVTSGAYYLLAEMRKGEGDD